MNYEQIMHIGFILFSGGILLYLFAAIVWSYITRQLLKPISSKTIEVYWGLIGWPVFNIFKAVWRDWQDRYQTANPQRRRGERDNIVGYRGKTAIPNCYGKSLQSGEGFDGPQSDFSVASSSEGFVAVSRKDLLEWASEWASENDPQDGTDVITPFDRYLYS